MRILPESISSWVVTRLANISTYSVEARPRVHGEFWTHPGVFFCFRSTRRHALMVWEFLSSSKPRPRGYGLRCFCSAALEKSSVFPSSFPFHNLRVPRDHLESSGRTPVAGLGPWLWDLHVSRHSGSFVSTHCYSSNQPNSPSISDSTINTVFSSPSPGMS